jgi:hypothetical protein
MFQAQPGDEPIGTWADEVAKKVQEKTENAK